MLTALVSRPSRLETRKEILNLDAIVATAIHRVTNNMGGISRTHNIAAATHTVSISANATACVRFRGIPSLWPPSSNITIVHDPGVRSQARCNHISVINCKAMGGTIPANPSGLPNAFVHNR